jgi:hypothetical protein
MRKLSGMTSSVRWPGAAFVRETMKAPANANGVRRGNRVLTTVAVEAALAAARTKQSYFGALYRRMARPAGTSRRSRLWHMPS